MSSKAILGIVVAVVVAGGGTWYFTTQNIGSNTSSLGGERNEKNETMEGMGAFKDLFTRGGSWKCEVKTTYAEAPSEGTFYISGEKFRGDFTAEIKGEGMVTSHIITADEYTYTWSDAYPQGMKIKISEESSGTAEGDIPETNESDAGFDYDQNVEYSCGPWAADNTQFVPPADISFMELGEGGMPQLPTSY